MSTCGRTRVVHETHPESYAFGVKFAAFDVDQLWRCDREEGHDGEHYGFQVRPDEPAVMWHDIADDKTETEDDSR